MNFYSCKVRLSGSVQNEVIKERVSAAEVLLLRKIHGNDAVLNIEHVASGYINYEEELDRLYKHYTKMVEHMGEEVPLVTLIYPMGKELPDTVPGIALKELPKKASGKPSMKDAAKARLAERKEAAEDIFGDEEAA